MNIFDKLYSIKQHILDKLRDDKDRYRDKELDTDSDDDKELYKIVRYITILIQENSDKIFKEKIINDINNFHKNYGVTQTDGTIIFLMNKIQNEISVQEMIRIISNIKTFFTNYDLKDKFCKEAKNVRPKKPCCKCTCESST